VGLRRWVKSEPRRELGVVLCSWALVTASLYLTFRVITTDRVALHFICFALVSLAILGMGVPVYWNSLVMGRPLSSIGVSTRGWVSSLLGGLAFTAAQVWMLPHVEFPSAAGLAPLVTMALCVGLFEAVFFRGWIQLRLEEAFGIIPAVVLGAGLYSLYHLGYGMTGAEMATLFVIGLVYAGVFRLTKNILIIWPFLTPSGGLFNNIREGLSIPFAATWGFGDTLIVMAGVLVCGEVMRRRLALRGTPGQKGRVSYEVRS